MRKIAGVLFLLFLAEPAFAHCYLCTAVTGSTVTTARLLGLGDASTGLLLGAFVISGALWIHGVLRRRNGNVDYIRFQSPVIILLSLYSAILGIYLSLYDELLGWASISSIVYGVLAGSAISYATFQLHYSLQRMNEGKNFVPFQGVALITLAMGISVGAVYITTGAT